MLIVKKHYLFPCQKLARMSSFKDRKKFEFITNGSALKLFLFKPLLSELKFPLVKSFPTTFILKQENIQVSGKHAIKGPYFSQEFCVIFLFVGAHNSKENIVNLLTKKVIWYPNFFFINVVPKRPWWPSGLSHCSNSSRVAAEDPGLNPAQVRLTN